MSKSIQTLYQTVAFVVCSIFWQNPAFAQGDPNRYSVNPENSSCRFFDGFYDNGNGTVTDPRSGLVWQRCSEGYAWNGQQCVGKKKLMNWFDAMKSAKKNRYLNNSDWRLPTYDEMLSVTGVLVRFDADKLTGVCENNPSGTRATSNLIFHAIENSSSYTNFYWTSTPDENYSSRAMVSNMEKGNLSWNVIKRHKSGGNDRLEEKLLVRFVRDAQGAGSSEFNREYAKIGRYKGGHSTAVADDERKKEARENERQISQNRNSGARGRGGLRELVLLDTKAYAARCFTDNSAILTFDRNPMGQYCGESLVDGFKCFSTPSLAAEHICK